MTQCKRLPLVATLLLVCVSAPPFALADTFPAKSITIIVPYTSGGATDTVARLVARRFSDSVKQPVVVENKPGAAQMIATEHVKRAPANGYTVLLGNFASHAVNPYLYAKLPYDPVKDFEPITTLYTIDNILVVPAGSAARNPADLVAMAKAKGGLAFGSMGIGSGGHLTAEMLKAQTGVSLTHVAYKGSTQAVQDLVANRLDFMFDNYVSSGGMVKDGRLRALATTGQRRSKLLPDVPTMTELGLPINLDAWFAVFAPAGTAAPIVNKLHAEFVQAVRSDELTKAIEELGLNVVTSKSPAELANKIAGDLVKYQKIVRDSGARVN